MNVESIQSLKLENAKLQNELDFTRTLLESANSIILRWDKDGVIHYMNNFGLRFFGYTSAELIGQRLISILPEVEKSTGRDLAKLARDIAKNPDQYRSITNENIAKDGRTVWVNWTNKGIFDEQGNVQEILAIGNDITARKQVEEKLRFSEKRSLSYLENSPACTKILDLDFNLQYISKAGIKGLNIDDIEDYYGKPYPFYFYPESFKKEMRGNLELAKETGGIITQEAAVVDIDRKELWFHSTIVPVSDDEGELDYLMVVSIETTDRKRVEEELENQKTTLESLLESIPDATVLVDQERCILTINRAFTETFGYTLDEMVGKPTSVFYESEEEFLRQGCLRFNMSSEEAIEPYIVTYRRKDGSFFPGETVGTKVFTQSGTLLGFFGLMRDVSDKLKQEEAHRQAQKMEAIGTLSGGIAHDFNNLLAIISSNIDIVQHKQQTGTSSEENIGHIKETVSRAKRLVTQILAFSRQEKHELSPIDFSIVIADSLKLLRSTIPTTIELLFEVESEPVFVNADTTQLQQVLINLCTNAVYAMDEKGLLRVSLGKVESGSSDLPERSSLQPGCYAKLSVSDTGCGIEREHIARIFDPFFTTKDVGTGTGMGLSAAYGVVEQHGGIITVDSTPGQGTTFHIYLPSIEGQQQEPKTNAEESLTTGTERILFVDDEECIAESCSELLEYQGYTVTSTTSSSEALELFKKSPEDFDLVFTDQTMPQMTGTELAKELLKTRPDIPIILCSGYAAKVSEDVAKGIGIREFCMKPMDIKKLTTVARKVLDENDSSS